MTSASPPKMQFDTTKDKSHLKKKYVPVDFKKLFVSRNIDKRLLCTSVCFMIPACLHFYYYDEFIISSIYTFECFIQIMSIYNHLIFLQTETVLRFNWISLGGCLIQGYYQRPDITSRVALLTLGLYISLFDQTSKMKMNGSVLLLCILNFLVRNTNYPIDTISLLKGFYWGLSFMFYPPLIKKTMKHIHDFNYEKCKKTLEKFGQAYAHAYPPSSRRE